MYSDVVALRDFYTTPMGGLAARLLGRRLAAFWPDLRGLSVLGLGFATPYLDQLASHAQRRLAMMPASQGVLPWPENGPARTALVEESALPLADAEIDRVLLVHALECSPAPQLLLDEVWRVLAGQGRVLVAVPNRSGIWARLDSTPFGTGHPFTDAQLTRLLRHHGLIVEARAHSLFVPPLDWSSLRALAPAAERFGARYLRTFAGVRVVEAKKQVFAPRTPNAPARTRVVFPVPVRPAGVAGA